MSNVSPYALSTYLPQKTRMRFSQNNYNSRNGLIRSPNYCGWIYEGVYYEKQIVDK